MSFKSWTDVIGALVIVALVGVLLSGFFYPVVPMGQARVRVQLSAAHTREQLDTVLKAFEQAGRELGILKI